MKRVAIAGWFVCSLLGQDWGPAQFLVGGQPGSRRRRPHDRIVFERP
jgi:hypothetical protein